MIYKVFYQPKPEQVPVRENTESFYVEASSEREARKILADKNISIEFVQQISGVFLEYEKQNLNFKVEQG
ncbi:DNA-dependent RNA polymerase subunit epsilon [Alkalihalobacterium alkalinitrilicum]|uniref:DNA-dependent RNA polymerase subunit epsilon n=1 Tax=Alkalihalobacterium alkalinitrilicum TaxID=427920 RepID=UPI000995AB21|nr:DNA-directed RNA polymerase subunit epsilon [Alkalihalobacterium alkalinitrilicum]